MKEEEGGGGRGGKRGGLTDVSCHRRYPGITGLYPEPPKKGELELGPTRNQTRKEPELEFSAKRRQSVSNPPLRLRAFDQILASRTWGLEKRGRVGRVKERKERGKGREVNSLLLLTGWGTLASCPHQEEPRDKKVPVAASGSGPSAGKLVPEYPK